MLRVATPLFALVASAVAAVTVPSVTSEGGSLLLQVPQGGAVGVVLGDADTSFVATAADVDAAVTLVRREVAEVAESVAGNEAVGTADRAALYSVCAGAIVVAVSCDGVTTAACAPRSNHDGGWLRVLGRGFIPTRSPPIDIYACTFTVSGGGYSTDREMQTSPTFTDEHEVRCPVPTFDSDHIPSNPFHVSFALREQGFVVPVANRQRLDYPGAMTVTTSGPAISLLDDVKINNPRDLGPVAQAHHQSVLITDPDTDISQLEVTVTSSNPDVVTAIPFQFRNVTDAIEYNTTGVLGSSVITVTVRDPFHHKHTNQLVPGTNATIGAPAANSYLEVVRNFTVTVTGRTPTNFYYAFAGSQQVWVVPPDVTEVTARVWGASGSTRSTSLRGGAGGFTEGTISVTPGEQYAIIVGGCGFQKVGKNNAGGGGGLSGIFSGSFSDSCFADRNCPHGSALLVAGGGGGAGSSYKGGAGGGDSGQRGDHNQNGGFGGSQTSPGANPGGYSGDGAGCLHHDSGSNMHGGAGSGCVQTGVGGYAGGGQGGGDTGTNGGGGGGGYYGGGGGGGSPNSGAGGGGSGFKGHSQVTNGKTLEGDLWKTRDEENNYVCRDTNAGGCTGPSDLYSELKSQVGYAPGVPENTKATPQANPDFSVCTGHGAIVLRYDV